MKKGSMWRHMNRYHKKEEPELMLPEEVDALNKKWDQDMNTCIKELSEQIDLNVNHFNNINMDDYLKIFDESTNKPATMPTDEEFQDIQNKRLNMSDTEFQEKEQDLLNWAAAY